MVFMFILALTGVIGTITVYWIKICEVNMIVEIICDGKRINRFREEDWGNPFDEIPEVGDYVELGEHCIEVYEPQPMIIYEVVKRTFSAVIDYNRDYTNKKCVLEVEEVKQYPYLAPM